MVEVWSLRYFVFVFLGYVWDIGSVDWENLGQASLRCAHRGGVGRGLEPRYFPSTVIRYEFLVLFRKAGVMLWRLVI